MGFETRLSIFNVPSPKTHEINYRTEYSHSQRDLGNRKCLPMALCLPDSMAGDPGGDTQ